jgi:hypothetical protein
MSRSKGNRTVNEKAKPFYEGLGYKVDKVEFVSRYATKQDLFSTIFEDEEEDYSDSGFDIVAISPDRLILVQVCTNSPKTRKWYLEFASRYANDYLKVHVFTHYDGDGFRIQDYQADGSIIETDLRQTKNDPAGTIWWFLECEKTITEGHPLRNLF